MANVQERNLQAMGKMGEGFNRRDVEAILAQFSEDAVFDTSQGSHPWGERFEGKAAIGTAVESVSHTLPDIQFLDLLRWVCGERGVAEWTCVATTPKGRRMEARGCDLFQFHDGKVIRKDTYFKNVVRAKP